MDLSKIFQLRDKNFWWVDIIYYFAISLLISMVFCYAIFIAKNIIQNRQIKIQIEALKTVGTDEQKNYEKTVIEYQKKFRDFNTLLKNHTFASNALAFMQQKTRSNIWFRQFNLDEKNNIIQLSGEADNMDALSRQVADFEKDKYVKNVGPLSSNLSATGKIGFNVTLLLDQKIFTYLSELSLRAKTPVAEETAQLSENQTELVEMGGEGAKSSLKIITLFNLPLNPQITGLIDQTKNTVALEVPYKTDVTRLVPSINVSPLAKITPAIGLPQDFTNSVVYKVTAEDESSQNYTVSVTVLPKPQSSRPAPVNIVIFILIALIVVSIIVGTILIILKKTQKK